MHEGTTGVRRYGVLAAIALAAGLGASGEIDGLAAGMLSAPFDAVRPAPSSAPAVLAGPAPRSLTAASAAVSVATADGNLVPNGSFEGGLTGWDGFDARLALVRGGVDGAWAARVRRKHDDLYSIYTPRRPVASTVGGAVYTASAWVRSDAPQRDRQVCLRIREWAGALAGAARTCFVLTSQWRRLGPLSYTAVRSGRELDVYLFAEGRRHESFDVDAVVLQRATGSDLTAPTVSLTAPADGATVGGGVTLAADAADDRGIQRVDFLVDGVVVGSDSSAPYSFDWNSLTSNATTATITARARDTSANQTTSAARTVTLDNTPPETTVDSGPPDSTTASSASFAFSSSESGSTFTCSLDGAAPAVCSSPKAYSGVAVGSHTFSVAARDPAGNVDATPATRTWVVLPAPPETAFVSGPSGTTRTNEPSFGFSSDRSGVAFECSLDGAAFAACTSPYTAYVASGRHELQVRAVDAAGTDATPAARSWWSDGLLQNGNFESSNAGWARQNYVVPGWKGYNAVISQVGGGARGPGAGRVVFATGDSYSIYSSPKPVNSSLAGAVYTATGSVRSDTPGRTLCLRVREFSNGVAGEAAQSCLVASTTWQSFDPAAFTASANGNEIEVYVYQATDPGAGDSFEVDGIALADGAADPVLPAEGPDPVLIAVSDVASCWSSGDEAVARILDTLPGTIGIAGDTEQNYGTAEEFAGCYDPAWGRLKSRTKPAIGDHEYQTYADAYPYFDYFGEAAGPRLKGWYSYELAGWHIVVLNSQKCREAGGCGPGTEQYEWLKADLAANATSCTAAYFQHPRFSAGALHGNIERVQPFWDLLYRYSAEFVYSGNDHTYQRWAPQNAAGQLDPNGIRQFVVGEGGTIHYELVPNLPANVEVANTGTFGVTAFTLRPGAYDWRFVPQSGKTFTDSGTGTCTPLPTDATPPTVSLTAPADGATVGGTVTLTAEAADDRLLDQVEFLVDGVVVGRDQSAPYSYGWDSTTSTAASVAIAARAIDVAGNRTTSPSRTVTLDNTPPETTIDSGPSDPSDSTTATFSFSAAGEPGATFVCSLDGAPAASCSSPTTVSGLDNGPHTFRVAARDAAGSVDATPAERSWTVDAPNLMTNGGFEDGLGNWRPNSRATLALVSPGSAGVQAARVSWVSGTDFSIFPSPRPVLAAVPGRTYVARAWVRSETPGRRLCLYLREWVGTGGTQTKVGESRLCISASTADWQQLPPVRLTAVGANQLEILIAEDGALPSDSFDVDEITLR